jgi:hypothetical protein
VSWASNAAIQIQIEKDDRELQEGIHNAGF